MGVRSPRQYFVHRWVTRNDVEDFQKGEEHGAPLSARCSQSATPEARTTPRPSTSMRISGVPPVPVPDFPRVELSCRRPRKAPRKRAHLFRWPIRSEDFDLGSDRRELHARPASLPMTRMCTASDVSGSPAGRLRTRRRAKRRRGPAARAEDPVAYDWLSRLGILAECVREKTRRHRERCAVRPVCRVSLRSGVRAVSASRCRGESVKSSRLFILGAAAILARPRLYAKDS